MNILLNLKDIICPVNSLFFLLLFGCPAVNFGPFSRGQAHPPDVNHCVLHF